MWFSLETFKFERVKKVMTKVELRKRMLADRGAKSLEFVDKNSEMIYNNFVVDKWFVDADTVFIYVSFQNEVSTLKIIKFALECGKRVCVPLIDENYIMRAVQIDSLDELVLGKYGILSPKSGQSEVYKSEIDLVVVPIVAVDDKGNRIGFGAGYYDKFLSDYNSKTIGLCFSFQIVENCFAEKFDKKIMKIICEDKKIEN